MKRARFIGGLLLIAAAAVIFLFKAMDTSIAVPIALAVVGIALIATSRRMR
jgi:hypothetical protein